MLGLAAEKRFRDKEREICVLDTCLLEHLVESLLHLLPYGIAIGFDNHAAPDGALLCKVSLHNKFVIPFRVVFATFCKVF